MQLSRVNRAEPNVAERLHAAAIHLLRRLRRQDDAMGLTPARASALSIMVFGGRVTIGQLAQAEQVSAPTMTRLIVGLERDGLVRREDDPNDGRVVWLEATAKGTRILHEGRRRRVEALAADLATLEPAERDTLAQAADIIERVLASGSKKLDGRTQKHGQTQARPPGGRIGGRAR
jgi:DNA-binding MarR family transcriptional regulator